MIRLPVLRPRPLRRLRHPRYDPGPHGLRRIGTLLRRQEAEIVDPRRRRRRLLLPLLPRVEIRQECREIGVPLVEDDDGDDDAPRLLPLVPVETIEECGEFVVALAPASLVRPPVVRPPFDELVACSASVVPAPSQNFLTSKDPS